MNKKLFIDMDGVLAEWRWDGTDHIYEEGYYANLKPLLAVSIVNSLLHSFRDSIYILSAVLTDSPFAESEKRKWLKDNLPDLKEENILFSGYGMGSKSDFIKEKFGEIDANYLLLDDYGVNLKEWAGTPIKFYNGVNGRGKTRYEHSVGVNENLIAATKRLSAMLS